MAVRDEGAAAPGGLAVTGHEPHLPGQLIDLGLLASDNPHGPVNNHFKNDFIVDSCAKNSVTALWFKLRLQQVISLLTGIFLLLMSFFNI